MRRATNAIALILITAFFPKIQPSRAVSFTPQSLQDDSTEVGGEDRHFVNALYVRIDDLLNNEHNKYYEPYSVIKLREYQIKEQLDQTLEKRESVQKHLKLNKEEAQELRNAINKAGTPEERAKLSLLLESVEKERKKAELEANTLSASTKTLNDLLQAHRVMHFAEVKALKAQIDRINKQKMDLFYKRADWDLHNTFKDYVALRNYLVKTANVMGLMCNVSIKSMRDSVETTGVTIKYQTPEQRQFGKGGLIPALTAKCTTTCSEEMKPNKYYIWTERGDKPSSDPQKLYVITGASQSVTLQESPP